MSKGKWLKITNILLGLSLTFQAVSGFLLEKVEGELLPTLHKYNGFVLVALALIHIYLNWAWVRANILKRRSAA